MRRLYYDAENDRFVSELQLRYEFEHWYDINAICFGSHTFDDYISTSLINGSIEEVC